MKWIEERHEYWWNYLLAHVPLSKNFDINTPEIFYTTRRSRVAATANRSYCEYNLGYVVQESQEEYDVTVCHEICHSFADRLVSRRAKHGTLWEYLFNIVCKQTRGQRHSYSCLPAKGTAAAERMKKTFKLLELQKKLDTLKSE